MMVELAERKGTSHIYGLLNPHLFHSVHTQDLMEQHLKERLIIADKKLYLLPWLD